MNPLNLSLKNLKNSSLTIALTYFQNIGKLANHRIKIIFQIPALMQESLPVALGVIGITNALFYSTLLYLTNQINHQCKKRVKSNATKKVFNHIILNALMARAIYDFNTWFSKKTRYPLSPNKLLAISVGLTALRFFWNLFSDVTTPKNHSTIAHPSSKQIDTLSTKKTNHYKIQDKINENVNEKEKEKNTDVPEKSVSSLPNLEKETEASVISELKDSDGNKIKDQENEQIILQIIPESIKCDQSDLVQHWLEKHQNDYISYSICENHIEKVIKRGAILPAEEVLKEFNSVEYEKDDLKNRVTRKLIDLTVEEIKLFEELDDDEEIEYKKLKEKNEKGLNQDEFEKLKKLNKEIFNHLSLEDQKKVKMESYSSKKLDAELSPQFIKEYMKKGLGQLPINQQKEYEDLSKLEVLSKFERDRLKTLSLHKKGIFVIPRHNQLFDKLSYSLESTSRFGKILTWEVNLLIEGSVAKKERYVDRENFVLSYFLKKSDNFYSYLTTKYQRWLKRGFLKKDINEIMCQVRNSNLCIADKLKAEIRTQKKAINWQEGHCVLLRGNTPSIISEETSAEAILLRPWENGGNYLNLELVQEDSILIGPQKKLEPHVHKLETLGVKFAYLESLTKKQTEQFKVPIS